MKKGSHITTEHKEKVSIGLKKYFKTHSVWNKGKRFVDHYKTAKEYRQDPEWYLRELKKNALKNRGKNMLPFRKKQIEEYRQKMKIIAGQPKRRKWTEGEIEYLRKNYKTKLVQDMALELERSWLAVNHKLSRLRLIYYHKW